MNEDDRRALHSFMVLHSFFETMGKRLDENNHKTGWKNTSFGTLLLFHERNVDQLKALLRDPAADKMKIKQCAADAANYLMMIANNASDPTKAIGKCDWCDDITNELSHPHLFDPFPGGKMCRNCWNLDREAYKGSYGEDIGDFVPLETSNTKM